MMKSVSISRIIAIILLFLTGVNALVAGYLFILDPSGNKMGMDVSYLQYSPFQSFLIPGLVLFFVNGILNVLAGILCIKKVSRYPLLIVLQGLLLCGWIVVQILMVRDINLLHGIMFTIGVALISCGFIIRKSSLVLI